MKGMKGKNQQVQEVQHHLRIKKSGVLDMAMESGVLITAMKDKMASLESHLNLVKSRNHMQSLKSLKKDRQHYMEIYKKDNMKTIKGKSRKGKSKKVRGRKLQRKESATKLLR